MEYVGNVLEDLKNESGAAFIPCLETLEKIIQNILKSPSEMKFRRLRKQNPNLHNRLCKFVTSEILLVMIGFELTVETSQKQEEIYIMNTVQIDILKQFKATIDSLIRPKPEPSYDTSNQRRDFLATVHEQRVKDKQSLRPGQKSSISIPPPSEPSAVRIYRPDVPAQAESHSKNTKRHMNLSDLLVIPKNCHENPGINPNLNALEPINVAVRIFQLSNQFRQEQGLAKLFWSDGVSEISFRHSVDMGYKRVPLGHQGFDNRVKALPFDAVRGAAENVAMSGTSVDPAAQAVNGWINSPGHRANLVGDFCVLGVGVFENTKGDYYFTQIFVKAFV